MNEPFCGISITFRGGYFLNILRSIRKAGENEAL